MIRFDWSVSLLEIVQQSIIEVKFITINFWYCCRLILATKRKGIIFQVFEKISRFLEQVPIAGKDDASKEAGPVRHVDPEEEDG